MDKQLKIDPATIKAIESVLSKGDRAEVIPVKDGVRVMRVRRVAVTAHDCIQQDKRKV